MKKLINIVLILLISAVAINAQDTGRKPDIIVTKKAEKIEAKILEVSADVVKYVKFNNQDGASYIIRTSDIASIQYGNGDIQTFEATAQQPQPQYQQNEVFKPQSLLQKEAKNNSFADYKGMPVYKKGKRYYFQDTEISMNAVNMQRFFKSSCTEAYKEYKKGRSLKISGIVSTVASIPFIAIGVSGASYSPYTYTYFDWYYTRDYNVILGFTVGSALLAGGVTMYAISFKYRKNALNLYNQNCIPQKAKNDVSLLWNVQPNAIGFQLNF
ncbi:MAG: hypothetical protein LBN95_09120 [Prevotellaceae bacterium]|jgi:hypothetical protein|nr:hypothetical protein [Prevotellaceae bacterium]